MTGPNMSVRIASVPASTPVWNEIFQTRVTTEKESRPAVSAPMTATTDVHRGTFHAIDGITTRPATSEWTRGRPRDFVDGTSTRILENRAAPTTACRLLPRRERRWIREMKAAAALARAWIARVR